MGEEFMDKLYPPELWERLWGSWQGLDETTLLDPAMAELAPSEAGLHDDSRWKGPRGRAGRARLMALGAAVRLDRSLVRTLSKRMGHRLYEDQMVVALCAPRILRSAADHGADPCSAAIAVWLHEQSHAAMGASLPGAEGNWQAERLAQVDAFLAAEHLLPEKLLSDHLMLLMTNIGYLPWRVRSYMWNLAAEQPLPYRLFKQQPALARALIPTGKVTPLHRGYWASRERPVELGWTYFREEKLRVGHWIVSASDKWWHPMMVMHTRPTAYGVQVQLAEFKFSNQGRVGLKLKPAKGDFVSLEHGEFIEYLYPSKMQNEPPFQRKKSPVGKKKMRRHAKW